MATSDELAERLLQRFKGVPNFELTDAQELVEESLRVHGLDSSKAVPNDKETLVLLYAQTQGAWQIALSVAHYFSFTDGEESVDKSMIADNNRRLARELQIDYEIENGGIDGNNLRNMPRLDRQKTTLPS